MKFGFRSTFKSLFNIKSWIGWDSLSKNTSWIHGLFVQLLRPPQSDQIKETYDEACARYGYTPEFLAKQQASFQMAARIYLGMLIIGFTYMAWLYIKKHRLATLLMIPVNFMLFSLFFRESFWLMQLRQKKLGMTFKDWVHIVVLNNG